jgi:hypothetical protein
MKLKRLTRPLVLLSLFSAILLAACGGDSSPDRASVVNQLQGCSKLASVEFVVSKMIIASKEKRFFGMKIFKDALFMAKTKAVIQAGIDFRKLKQEDVIINGRQINLNLPPVEIITFSYPADSVAFVTEYCSGSIFNSFALGEKDELFRSGETYIWNSLKHIGILEAAQEKTKTLLTGLLKSLEFDEVYISFKPNDELAKKLDGIDEMVKKWSNNNNQ